jgi:hypothetical protein
VKILSFNPLPPQREGRIIVKKLFEYSDEVSIHFLLREKEELVARSESL